MSASHQASLDDIDEYRLSYLNYQLTHQKLRLGYVWILLCSAGDDKGSTIFALSVEFRPEKKMPTIVGFRI